MESVVYYDKGDKEYPERMKPFPGMPRGIYVKGKLPRESMPSVAIVGGRACSPYGREQARRFARELAAAGVQIISGLASGVDAAAHEGALEGGGTTFAVLGCGVNICYPRENYPLMRRILEQQGGVLSEFPPGDRPLAWHFPQRNRIISALADLVLVVEARQKSGSLITADYALEQGKSVYALPGRVNDALSEGSNRLIAQGAGIAVEPAVLLEELGIFGQMRIPGTQKSLRRTGAPEKSPDSAIAGKQQPAGISEEDPHIRQQPGADRRFTVEEKQRSGAGRKLTEEEKQPPDIDRIFTEEEKRVILALKDGSRTLEELHRATRCSVSELSALLIRMQLDGILGEEGKNSYFLRQQWDESTAFPG